MNETSHIQWQYGGSVTTLCGGINYSNHWAENPRDADCDKCRQYYLLAVALGNTETLENVIGHQTTPDGKHKLVFCQCGKSFSDPEIMELHRWSHVVED